MRAFMSWRDRAFCAGIPSNAFFPPEGRGDTKTFYRDVKAKFCDHCPVARECGDAAIDEEMRRPGDLDEEVKGMRGGLMPSERIRIIRSRPDRQAVKDATFTRNVTRFSAHGSREGGEVKRTIAHGGDYHSKIMDGYANVVHYPPQPEAPDWQEMSRKIPADDHPHLTQFN